MEYTPATNGNGCWCLVHIEWIFFESSTRESSDNQDLAILWPRDLRHLPHPGEGELHFLLPPSPGFRAAQVWLLLKYIQISCTVQSLVVQFSPSASGRTTLDWYTGSGHRQAAAKGTLHGCDLLRPPALCPSYRGLPQVTKPSASSSLILLSNHLQSAHCMPDSTLSTYQSESFIPSNSLPRKRGIARISVLQMRNQNHGDVEHRAQGHTRTKWWRQDVNTSQLLVSEFFS